MIVDVARRRRAGRAAPPAESEILRVHDALDDLAARDRRMASIVEMRYFGGMTESEIAEAVGVNERTVRRDWEKARLFLREALGPPPRVAAPLESRIGPREDAPWTGSRGRS